jgi:hypothetical protein
MLNQGGGDAGIRGLKVLAGNTDYGCFMFSRESLQMFYDATVATPHEHPGRTPFEDLVYKPVFDHN